MVINFQKEILGKDEWLKRKRRFCATIAMASKSPHRHHSVINFRFGMSLVGPRNAVVSDHCLKLSDYELQIVQLQLELAAKVEISLALFEIVRVKTKTHSREFQNWKQN
jgi:hypothetical protein